MKCPMCKGTGDAMEYPPPDITEHVPCFYCDSTGKIDLPKKQELESRVLKALGTQTGRFDSSKPNRVNKPKGESEMKELAIHLSVYIRVNEDPDQKRAEELVRAYLEQKGVEDYQLYDIEVRE